MSFVHIKSVAKDPRPRIIALLHSPSYLMTIKHDSYECSTAPGELLFTQTHTPLSHKTKMTYVFMYLCAARKSHESKDQVDSNSHVHAPSKSRGKFLMYKVTGLGQHIIVHGNTSCGEATGKNNLFTSQWHLIKSCFFENRQPCKIYH